MCAAVGPGFACISVVRYRADSPGVHARGRPGRRLRVRELDHAENVRNSLASAQVRALWLPVCETVGCPTLIRIRHLPFCRLGGSRRDQDSLSAASRVDQSPAASADTSLPIWDTWLHLAEGTQYSARPGQSRPARTAGSGCPQPTRQSTSAAYRTAAHVRPEVAMRYHEVVRQIRRADSRAAGESGSASQRITPDRLLTITTSSCTARTSCTDDTENRTESTGCAGIPAAPFHDPFHAPPGIVP
jgi:hypothetical protein